MPNECEYCAKHLKKLQIKRKQRFCSRECKSLSQVRRISVSCDGCGKSFSKMPCFERSHNYCSLKCYWDSTRRKEIRNCKVCGKKFWATKVLLDHGFGIFCSRECQHKTYPKQIKKICAQCKKPYFVPPSWVGRGNYCSKKCRDDSMRDYVSSVCRKCGKRFELPRGDRNRGRGNFCTFRCYLKYRGPSTLEEKMERALTKVGIKYQREVKFGRFHADFLLKETKLIIECDGEYWHMRPNIKERDRRKGILLESLGYKLMRLFGKLITKSSETELSKIVQNYI